MNMSQAVSHIKMALGLYGVTLPFKDDNGAIVPTENVIYDVLRTITIPVYSQFVPWIREADTKISLMEPVDKLRGIYLLPPALTITPVLYVVDVHPPFQNNRGTYGDIAPVYGINPSAQGVITSQAYMMIAGQMRAEPTFDYLGHNKVRLYGYPNCVITIKVACQHEPNGETIEDGCYDSFMELGMLDVKMFLYNNLKLYDGIPTAFGNINLKLDEYQSADGDRNTLLERWRDVFHLDMGWEEWM